MIDQDADNSGLLDIRPLREQIYEYLRSEIQAGRLKPGEFIKLNIISERLGVSKTPLRDALIQLECKEFVEILPRRGVLVKKLTLEKIKNMLEIGGALESSVLISVFDQISKRHLDEMAGINDRLRRAMTGNPPKGFDKTYYQLNIAFHAVFLNLSDNRSLRDIILPIKQRLYDFPRKAYNVQWELANCDEHDELIRLIDKGAADKAAALWRDSHWSFDVHEQYIREYYNQV